MQSISLLLWFIRLPGLFRLFTTSFDAGVI
jgi:hypothetical protein